MLAIATTTVTIRRAPLLNQDPYDVAPGKATVASGVRAHIGAQRFSSSQQGSQQETVTWRLDTDPCDLQAGDEVEDDSTGDLYDVTGARQRPGFGLDHVEAVLTQVSARNPSLA